jgi:hypothetical protein
MTRRPGIEWRPRTKCWAIAMVGEQLPSPLTLRFPQANQQGCQLHYRAYPNTTRGINDELWAPIETRLPSWCRIGKARQVARSVYPPASRGLPDLSDEANDPTGQAK